jgi:hypothetical protein
MRRVSAISVFMAALAMLAIVIAPMTTSVAASAMAMKIDMTISDGMPCCPDDQPAVPDCAKGCPYAVVCTSAFVCAPMPEYRSLSMRLPVQDRFAVQGDEELSSLVDEPPPRPPKA